MTECWCGENHYAIDSDVGAWHIIGYFHNDTTIAQYVVRPVGSLPMSRFAMRDVAEVEAQAD